MNNPLISVIVPTYRRKPELISRAITSILSQTYSNIELIVVDDSPESFKNRKDVQNYLSRIGDDRISYIKHDINRGANKARNTGIEASNGEFIAFLDDDDEWLPEKLELQIEKFDNKNIALVYCQAVIIDEMDGSVRPILNQLKKGKHYYDLLKQNFIGSNSFVLIRSNIIKEVGMYDENLLSNQDYDLFLKIAKRYEINFVDKILVRYYIHEGDRISTNQEKQLQGRLGLEKNFKVDIEKDDELKLIWGIKKIPLYYNVGQKAKAFSLMLSIFLKHPIFFIKYIFGTLQYINRKKKRMR